MRLGCMAQRRCFLNDKFKKPVDGPRYKPAMQSVVCGLWDNLAHKKTHDECKKINALRQRRNFICYLQNAALSIVIFLTLLIC